MITALSGIDHCARTALGWTVMWCRAEVSMKWVIFNEMLRNAHCLNLKTVRWEAAKHHWMVFAWSVNRNFTQTQKRLRCEFFPVFLLMVLHLTLWMFVVKFVLIDASTSGQQDTLILKEVYVCSLHTWFGWPSNFVRRQDRKTSKPLKATMINCPSCIQR